MIPVRYIGDVVYGECAFEHMRELHGLAQRTLDGTLDPAVVNEAAVIHEFHVQFPGVVMKEPPRG